MSIVVFLINFTMRIDQHLLALSNDHGTWDHGLLFRIVFVEISRVVMLFLPGDSLLLVVGALGSVGEISLPIALGVLLSAAIAGGQANYSVGRGIGLCVFRWEQSRWFNRQAFDRAHVFYERYFSHTVSLARFMLFIRTFELFVAGVKERKRRRFTAYNVVCSVKCMMIPTLTGYLLGNTPFVKENPTKFVWILILIPGAVVIMIAWKSPGSGNGY